MEVGDERGRFEVWPMSGSRYGREVCRSGR